MPSAAPHAQRASGRRIREVLAWYANLARCVGHDRTPVPQLTKLAMDVVRAPPEDLLSDCRDMREQLIVRRRFVRPCRPTVPEAETKICAP
jgi:hypothetical protein